MRVGFIGLGTMGGGMALNLRKAGHDVVVHDVNHAASARHIEAGCTWADSPKEVGAASEVVFTSLPGPVEVEQVGLGPDGLIEGMAPGTVWFDLSTNSPAVVRRIHAAFAEKGVSMLDSPVSGGPAGANNGTLALWVGGNKDDYERMRPVIEAIGDKPNFIGEIGSGSIAKLVHNTAGYALNTALAEVFTTGVKAGVPPLALWAAIRQGANGRMRVFDSLGGHFLQQHFDPPAFALKLAHKDVRLMTELAKEVSVPMRLANITLEEMTEALNRGWEGRDSRVAMMLQVERAGLDPETMKFTPEEIDVVRKQSQTP
ncbi:MAG TPA: NAD(P)-dependent oxidoreductase [Dehalococcoidia bacterium]|nr:NAD(P)-dependent oxidoreductase [Dehalococcoidia bacterium]